MQPKFVDLYFLFFVLILFDSLNTCTCEKVKKSVDNDNGDNVDPADDGKDASLEIPPENETNNVTCARRSENSLMHEIRSAQHKQFPFVASLMSSQNEHLCSGTVVSNGLILTTAECTLKPISHVLLNATKSKKDESTIDLHVTKSENYPTATTSELEKNVGLLYTEKHNNTIAAKIKLSNYTDARSIIDMEAIGFGLNAEVGQTKTLQYIGLENRIQAMFYSEMRNTIVGFIDCIDTEVPTCFKDVGGPVIYDNELIGIVIKGDNTCATKITSNYALNKRVVTVVPTYTFKAWLDDKIKKYEEAELVALATYPNKPLATRRNPVHKMTSHGIPTATFAFWPIFIIPYIFF